jgi:hypothetical protein
MNKDRFLSITWSIPTFLVMFILLNGDTRTVFIELNHLHPLLMGFIKFFILATLGEVLGRRLALGKWQFRGISLLQRAFVWGCFGYIFTFIFPLFSAGVEELNRQGLLYRFVPIPFWKSFFINIIFAFPFMTLHKITDTLIDQKMLFSKWPFLSIWKKLDWDTQWKKVAPTILWFWIPAHTITFSLPSEYRILLAAFLGIILGIILSFFNAKKV